MNRSMCHRRERGMSGIRGFTIIELSIVLVVVALLLGTFITPLSNQVDQRSYGDTQRRLQDIGEALIGYAVANGRFPCPASSGVGGWEAFATGGTPGSTTNGICASFSGYVPGIQLGLTTMDSQGYAIDAWTSVQNRIRYVITNQTVNGVTNPFTAASTPTSGMRGAGVGGLGTTCPYLSVSTGGFVLPICNPPAGTSPPPGVLSNGDAVFVLYSVGKDATDQQTGGGGLIFRSELFSTATFDDQVLWVSRYTVINRMIQGGQLP